MRVGVLGTGGVGQTLAAKFASLDHEVMMGTRDVQACLARSEAGYGAIVLSEWTAKHPEVKLGTFAEAAAHGEIVVNATNGAASLDALKLADSKNLDGKVLIDVANRLQKAETLTIEQLSSGLNYSWGTLEKALKLLEVEGARSLSYWAGWALDNEPETAARAASMAKAYAGDAGFRVAASALQVHGGIGFTWEHDLHFFLKRAKANAHAFGDARWHRDRVAELAGI